MVAIVFAQEIDYSLIRIQSKEAQCYVKTIYLNLQLNRLIILIVIIIPIANIEEKQNESYK